jgi:hypothetical protein
VQLPLHAKGLYHQPRTFSKIFIQPFSSLFGSCDHGQAASAKPNMSGEILRR